jgi:hypothetical protein
MENNLTKSALCAFSNCNQTALTIHAELLLGILSNRITRLTDNTVQQIINRLAKREKNLRIKNELIDLLGN